MALTVTYTINDRKFDPSMGWVNIVTLAMGDGAETYATGPSLDGNDLGLPGGNIESLSFEGGATSTGLVPRWDSSNENLELYEGDYAQAGDSPLVELDSGDTPAAMTMRAIVRGY